jgi:hypothetical protein
MNPPGDLTPPLPFAAAPQARTHLPEHAPNLLWGQEQILSAAGPPVPWLWHGFLLPGALTLLTSLWKTGKTTLVSVLVARRQSAGLLGGLPLAAGRSVIITEEHPDHWRRRTGHLNFADNLGLYCRPFRGQPTPQQWETFIEELAALRGSRGVDLVVIDPLAAFMAGGSENEASCMLRTLQPLQRLTAEGMSILALHHPRREPAAPGQAARGNGALQGFADILVEMHWLRAPSRDDRRRRLLAFSRYPETPTELVLALNADGTDYLAWADLKEAEFAEHWPVLQAILEKAPRPLNRRAIRQCWPQPRPDAERMNNWLENAVSKGLLRKWGKGVKRQPFHYWLPSREQQWLEDPLAELKTPELFYPAGFEGKKVDRR